MHFLLFVDFLLESINVAAEDLLDGLRPLLSVVLAVMAVSLDLLTLASWTAESSIGQTYTVELETHVVLAFAAFASLGVTGGLSDMLEVLILSLGLLQDPLSDHLYLLFFLFDVLLLILLGSTRGMLDCAVGTQPLLPWLLGCVRHRP